METSKNILLTPNSSSFDLNKPAKSKSAKALNIYGNQVMDKLKLTGRVGTRVNHTTGEQWTELECQGTFQIFYIHEKDLIQ